MEEKFEVPKEAAPEAAAPKVAPMVATSKESVPCFRATPLQKKEPIFVDKNEQNLFTSKWGFAKTDVFLCTTELKYGQCAILAMVGYAFYKLDLSLDKISLHEYLSMTNNVKFVDCSQNMANVQFYFVEIKKCYLMMQEHDYYVTFGFIQVNHNIHLFMTSFT